MSVRYDFLLDKVVLFGDSITFQMAEAVNGFNFYGALQHWYNRRLDVVLRGFGGYNSEHGRRVLPRLLAAETAAGAAVRLVVVFFGTNDSADNWQRVSLERYGENLAAMVQETRARCPGADVVLVGPGPHDDANYAGEADESDPRSNARNAQYAARAKEVAARCNAPYVDLFSALGAPDPGLLPDTVHFSPAAYKLFYDELVYTIRSALPHLVPENLQLLLPHHSDLEQKGNSLALLDG